MLRCCFIVLTLLIVASFSCKERKLPVCTCKITQNVGGMSETQGYVTCRHNEWTITGLAPDCRPQDYSGWATSVINEVGCRPLIQQGLLVSDSESLYAISVKCVAP